VTIETAAGCKSHSEDILSSKKKIGRGSTRESRTRQAENKKKKMGKGGEPKKPKLCTSKKGVKPETREKKRPPHTNKLSRKVHLETENPNTAARMVLNKGDERLEGGGHKSRSNKFGEEFLHHALPAMGKELFQEEAWKKKMGANPEQKIWALTDYTGAPLGREGSSEKKN